MKKKVKLLILSIGLSFGSCTSGVDLAMEAYVFLGWASWICNWVDPYNNNPICQNVRNGAYCVQCSSGTVPGNAKTTGGVEIWVGNEPSGKVITQCVWTPNAYSNKCGSFNDDDDTCTIGQCNKFGNPSSTPTNSSLIGYDLTASDPPVGVKSISPASPAVIYENQILNIQFDGSVKSDSISFSGSMNPELNPNFRFGRTVDYNDTLPLAAGSKWSLGAAKQLQISLVDMNDKPVVVPLIYHVIKVGTSKTPSFTTCENGCKADWLNAYSIAFTASGGVPPYTWFAATEAPPEANLPPGSLPPGASFSKDGVLSGPATGNFMNNAVWGFGVVVVDSAGQMGVKVIVIDSIDLVAQYAACVAAGICN